MFKGSLNKVLRNILGAKRAKLQDNGESHIMMCYIHSIVRLI